MNADPRGRAAAHPSPRPGAPLRFRVEGLDCQSEVRILKAAVAPLVGGEEGLFFEAKAGLMTVASPGGASAGAIAEAVARAGMWAELLRDDAAAAAAPLAVAPAGQGEDLSHAFDLHHGRGGRRRRRRAARDERRERQQGRAPQSALMGAHSSSNPMSPRSLAAPMP